MTNGNSIDDANAAYKRGDYETALRLFAPLAEQGDRNAQYGLGFMYSLGLGTAQNFAEAVRWLQKSARQGLPSAQFSLAIRYHNGEGVPQNFAEAVNWYKQAAEQGHATHKTISADFIVKAK